MNRFSARIFAAFVLFLIGASVVGWVYYRMPRKPQVVLPEARWEKNSFKEINRASYLAGISELRETELCAEDIEVRIWRGGGLSPLEGVVLKRVGGEWSALHIKMNEHNKPEEAELTELNPPKSGWESFWKQLDERGILTLPDPPNGECRGYPRFEGSSYIVEINRNNIYRTYMYSVGIKRCVDATQIEEIGEIIGLEFDSGQQPCKRAEWLACATFRKSRNQNPE